MQNGEYKKLLLQLRKEIKFLDNKIKYLNIINNYKNVTKNFKIFLVCAYYFSPYVLTAALIAGIFKIIGVGFPFYGEDTFKYNANVKKEFDNNGNIRIEKQYEDYESSTNLLFYYSKWKLGENGFYQRNVNVYEIKELNEEDILNLFEKENLKIGDIFGEPLVIKKEIKNNVSDSELIEDDILQALIYDEDKNDYIFIKETVSENLLVTIIYLMITISTGYGFYAITKELPYFDLHKAINNIKEKSKKISKEDIEKLLELKKNNYDRLMR